MMVAEWQQILKLYNLVVALLSNERHRQAPRRRYVSSADVKCYKNKIMLVWLK